MAPQSEANLVVFFNHLTSFKDQLKRQGEFIEETRKLLCQLQQEKPFQLKFEVQSSEQPISRSLSFKLSSQKLQQEMESDVQPACDVLYEVRNYTHFDSS
jgi:2'-5'-oligoadenylate synthetase